MSLLWMPKEVELIKTMLDAGKAPEEIALVLKSRSITSIRNKAAREGFKLVTEPDIDMAAFKKIMGTK